MLTSRLVRLAKDILEEYSKFNIMSLLEDAKSLSASREGIREPEYSARADQIRDKAKNIINTTVIAIYPDDLRQFLNESQYSAALPGAIADTLIKGLPSVKAQAMSSGEVNLYINLAHGLLSDLNAFVNTTNKFGIRPVEIPDGVVGIDITIPRQVFDNKMGNFLKLLERFTRIITRLVEVRLGSEEEPGLLYTSTSDPVTVVAVLAGGVWTVLQFYKLILEVAQKHIDLLKTLRTFEESGVQDTKGLAEQIERVVSENLERAIEKATMPTPEGAPAARVNEIQTAIRRDAPDVLFAVARGARIGISLESLDNLVDISKEENISLEKIHAELKQQRIEEHKVYHAMLSLEGQAAALLVFERPQETELPGASSQERRT